MDKIRTNWIIIILILFFAVFILSHLFSICRKESFSTQLSGDTYIDGKFTFSDAPERRHSKTKVPLEAGWISSESNCTSLCKNQNECLDTKSIKCTSTYQADNKNCYCQFSRVEGFDTFSALLNLPKEAQPSWESSYFKGKWNPVKRQSFGTWNDLKIDQRNSMSISFWIYFNESVMLKNPAIEWVSLFQVTSPDFTPVSNFNYETGNDGYIMIQTYSKTARLHIRGKTSVKGNRHDPDEASTAVPIPGKNYVGFNVPDNPTFVVITYINNKYTFYRDGIETNSYTSSEAYVEPKPDSKLFGGYVFANVSLEPQGISMKDLKVYNGAISAKTIELLYSSLKKDEKGVGWRTDLTEAFTGRQGFTGYGRQGFTGYKTVEGFENDEDVGNDAEGGGGEEAASGFAGPNIASTYISDNGNNTFLEPPNIVAITKMEISGLGFGTLQMLSSPAKQQCAFSNGSREYANGQGNPRKGNLEFDYVGYWNNKVDTKYLIPPFNKSNVNTEIGKYLANPNLAPENGKRMDGVLYFYNKHPTWGNWMTKYLHKNHSDPSKRNLRSGLASIANDFRSFNSDGYNGSYECNSLAPVCSNFVHYKRWGACSVKSAAKDQFALMTVMVQDSEKNAVEKKLSSILLNPSKEEQLEMPTKFNPGSVNGFTICFWVKILKYPQGNPRIRIFSFCNKIGYTSYDKLSISIKNQKLDVQIEDTFYSSPVTNIADLNWHHIAWSVDKNGSWSIYHNGRGYASNPVKGIYPSSNPRNKQLIGGPISYHDASLDGYVGDIRFYDGILSQDEVWTIRNNPR